MEKSIKIMPLLLMIILTISCSTPLQQKVDNSDVPSTQPTNDTQVKNEKPDTPEEPVIIFEEIEILHNLDRKNLHEITDQEILSEIIKMFPEAQDYLSKTSLENEDVFQVIIPLEIDPVISKEIIDLIKGLINDRTKIKKYADKFNSDFNQITDQTKYFMGVRNYYMLAYEIALSFLFNEINIELDKMDGVIQEIKEFQDREFKSRIMSSYSRIKELSTFTLEIVEREEVRLRNLNNLEDLKTDVMQQIDQVNLTITDTATGELNEFDEYIGKINDEAILIEYQRVLLNMLEEISNLMYVFSKGELSSDMSYLMYNEYIDKANEARVDLSSWHNIQFGIFGVDLANKKVDKDGVEGIISYIPGVFNKDWRKKELSGAFIERIKDQTKKVAFAAEKPQIFTNEQVKIIIMEGKLYYMYPS